MYSLWWLNHIVPVHVSRVAKNIACCVWKISQDCISVYTLWRFEIWENHFNSYTIITAWWRLSLSRYILWLPHLLEDMFAIMYKTFWFFLLLFFFAYFLLLRILLGSKDLGSNVFRTLMCNVGKPCSKQVFVLF